MTLSLRRAVRALVVLPVLAALTTLVPTAAQASSANAPNSERQVTLMTRNLYLGADLTPLAGATSTADIQAAVGTILAHVEMSRPDVRMGWVAGEIETAHPDIVALQEVADWTVNVAVPPYVAPGHFDFLAMLLADLKADGAPYHVVVSQDNFNSHDQLLGQLDTYATFVDRDVIIARDSAPTSLLKVTGTSVGRFTAQLNLSVAGTQVNFNRGYEWADIQTRGKDWRVVNTHPEAYAASDFGVIGAPDINALQMLQLAAALAGSSLPTVVLGDLNSRVGDPKRAGYATMLAAGFTDSWLALGLLDSASTCCYDETLSAGTLDERIDHVLLRGAVTPVSASHVGVGAVTGPPSPSPYWPSDHAGVVTTVSVGKQ